MALRLLDVLRPTLVVAGGIHRKADDLDVPAVEVGLDLRHVAELGRADRREVLRMREQPRPRVADPVVKADRPLSGLRLKVRRRIANLNAHALLLFRRSRRRYGPPSIGATECRDGTHRLRRCMSRARAVQKVQVRRGPASGIAPWSRPVGDESTEAPAMASYDLVERVHERRRSDRAQ